MIIDYEITHLENYDEEVSIRAMTGYMDGWNELLGLSIYFEVEILLSDENDIFEKRKIFNITMQSEERNNRIQGYSGYEMSYGSYYGVDDDHDELVQFLEENDKFEELEKIQKELVGEAQFISKQYLEELEGKN